MNDFNSILDTARRLSTVDRLKLIDALWETVPVDADVPLHPGWESELERRVAAIKSATGLMIPWSKIREEAMARTGHGDAGWV